MNMQPPLSPFTIHGSDFCAIARTQGYLDLLATFDLGNFATPGSVLSAEGHDLWPKAEGTTQDRVRMLTV